MKVKHSTQYMFLFNSITIQTLGELMAELLLLYNLLQDFSSK